MSDPIVEQCCNRHPEQAADVLRGLPQKDVLSFLTALPAAAAARVISRLDSQLLGYCMVSMGAKPLARIIASAGHEDSVEIISHLPSTRYDELISAYPAEEHQLSAKLYAYSRKTLGAIASPDFVRVKSGQLCGDVKQNLAAGEWDADAPLYLVDGRGMLLGSLPYLAVIADRNANAEVDRVSQPIQALSEHTTITAALDARQWARQNVLPVVDGKHRLIGTVTRDHLLRLALRADQQGYGLPDLAGDLISEYLSSCSNLLDMVLQGDRRRER